MLTDNDQQQNRVISLSLESSLGSGDVFIVVISVIFIVTDVENT